MKYSLIAILLFSFTALQAQVKGTVKDNLGDPIAGANLFWQRTTQGTTTSADGTFSCLLYTSPRPRDYAAPRMPSSA